MVCCVSTSSRMFGPILPAAATAAAAAAAAAAAEAVDTLSDPGLPVPAGLFVSSMFLSAAAEAVVALGPGLTRSIVASASRSSILLHLSSVRDS